MSGLLTKQKKFILKDFFKTHCWKNFSIKSLPGVFDHKKIDEGSKVTCIYFFKKYNWKSFRCRL
ncbi:hypothetical protein [Buchnera aphidicola]|uniref:hypothetical protein n=1 Tax=Buchnera aphidicola TaxID=9 RepID=UPI00130D5255|nr:hypothetical protein [Buchnera aphidicola]